MAFYTTSSQSMMMNGASARQAASASCAYSTEMSRASMMNIALILDAILLASIIICALVSITILVSVFVAGISTCHSGIRTGSGPVCSGTGIVGSRVSSYAEIATRCITV